MKQLGFTARQRRLAMMNDDWSEPPAPGWRAIDEALQPIYGGIEPMHWGTLLSWQLGGPDPIHGISAYRNNRSRNHLHFITYGFSELWEKESDDPQTSGFGFELTFRLACRPGEDAPLWAVGFLQNLGRYVFESGRRFGTGHTMPLNGPIASGHDTKIHAIAFAEDPELPPIDTPNGHVSFLQVVGLTEDELWSIEAWNAARFLDLVHEQNDLLITDLARDSYLTNAQFAARAREMTAAEGASAVSLWCDHASFECSRDACRLTFGVIVVRDLARRLSGRIPFGRPFSVLTESEEIFFEPGDHLAWEETSAGMRLILTPYHSQLLVEHLLKPHPGMYVSELLPGLTVAVEKTVLKDSDGNVVGEIT